MNDLYSKDYMSLFVKRVQRIIKMVRLNAPRKLITNDLQQVYSMIPPILNGIGDDEINDKNKVSNDLACQKNKLRICANEDCINEISHIVKEKIGSQLCYICQKGAE